MKKYIIVFILILICNNIIKGNTNASKIQNITKTSETTNTKNVFYNNLTSTPILINANSINATSNTQTTYTNLTKTTTYNNPTNTVNLYEPQNIKFDNSNIGQITLMWENINTKNVYFNIYKKWGKGNFYKINSSPLNVTMYVDSDVLTGTTYMYYIEAKDAEGNSKNSKIVSIKSKDLFLPGIPNNFKVYQDVEAVLLKWTPSQKGTYDISGYNIYRGRTENDLKLIKTVSPEETKYEDTDVKPAVKYYYKITAIDEKNNESPPTVIYYTVPLPPLRTGLILMPSAYRNNIFNNFGFNIDVVFTYYIGSIYGQHKSMLYGEREESFEKIGVWLLTADMKGTLFNEFDKMPSVGVGYIYTILLQDQIGSSETTTVSKTFNISGKNEGKESFTTLQSFYLSMSKKIIFDTYIHGGYLFGDEMTFLTYFSKYFSTEEEKLEGSYFLGFNRKLISRFGIKIEYIVPIQKNSNILLPSYYLINTHIDRFINFDIGYFHHEYGYMWVGYINFRFTIYPNPYK